VWVALGTERQLQQLDRRFVGQVVGNPVTTDQEPLAVLVVADRVCAAVTIRVECFRARDGAPAGSTQLIDTGATTLGFGAGTLWVGGQNAVTEFTPGALAGVGVPVAVPGRVTGIAFGRGFIWVTAVTGSGTARGAGTVSRLAPGASAPLSTFELDGRPTAVAYGEGAVWVAVDNGTLVRLDAATGSVTTTIEIGSHPTGVAVGDGRVWVAAGS
jgi:hypothetical protein